jgi:tRNA-binding EMAP/Myf-like protein
MKQERPNPKEIESKQALFVVNVEPRRMMGELSEGILLDISAMRMESRQCLRCLSDPCRTDLAADSSRAAPRAART